MNTYVAVHTRSSEVVRRSYANDRNAFRFMHRHLTGAGQYRLFRGEPIATPPIPYATQAYALTEIGTLYRTA